MRRVEDESVELIPIVAIGEGLRIVALVSHFHGLRAGYSISLSWEPEGFYIAGER